MWTTNKRLVMFGFILYKSAKLFTTAKVTNWTKESTVLRCQDTTDLWTIYNNRTNNWKIK